MIPFNIPAILGNESKYINEVFENKKFSGDGSFSKKCQAWLENLLDAPKALLTTSCTDALEMAAILLDIIPGDEVIMPSFTFVSTANAFVLRGAKIIFVDINPNTMNIDEACIERAITSKTKAIVVVHYAGWSCDMEKILRISKEHKLFVVEDAAQALTSTFKNKQLGSFGDLSCFSFHETKNFQCGEGGALVINNKEFVNRAEIIREKGTNRSVFLRGQTDKYTWVDIGSSFLPSEINAACLLAQLEEYLKISQKRIELWNYYKSNLSQNFEIVDAPTSCNHNAHLFAIKVSDIEVRTKLISHLKNNGVQAVFHYVPLHSSPAGLKFGEFKGLDQFTTKESDRMVRLPLYYDLSQKLQDQVIGAIRSFKN